MTRDQFAALTTQIINEMPETEMSYSQWLRDLDRRFADEGQQDDDQVPTPSPEEQEHLPTEHEPTPVLDS